MSNYTDIVQTKFKVRIPRDKWLSKASHKYPHLRIKILSMILVEKEQGNTLIQIEGVNLKGVLEYLTQILQTHQLIILNESSEAILLNLNTKRPWILSEFVEKKVPVRFPILIENGTAYFEIVAVRSQIDDLLSGIEEKSLNLSIKSIGRYTHPSILTERQKTILSIAQKKGLFENPRRINTTELAKILKISTSSLSETLRRIYKKLTDNYFKIG